MTTSVRSVPHLARPMVLDWPDRVQDCQKAGPAISGPAPVAVPPPNCDGLVQMAIKLDVLLAQAKHARNLRQNKRASLIEAEIRAQRLAIWGVERARREN